MPYQRRHIQDFTKGANSPSLLPFLSSPLPQYPYLFLPLSIKYSPLIIKSS